MPKVSIILPTYNGARFISGAIHSVLNQDFSDWELIVVDDGSTDDTEHIVSGYASRDPRVAYARNGRNMGIQKSLNNGLGRARGEYIARIDDDDRWVDQSKLSRQVAFLDAHADCVLVGTGAIVIDEKGTELFRFLNTQTDRDIRARLLGKNCFTHSSVLFRKSAAMQAGGYNESRDALHVEDYDLWLKLGAMGAMANLPMYAVQWMMRGNSLSSRNRIGQFWKSMRLAVQFRTHYPGFAKGFARSWVRLIAYGVFSFIPVLKLKYFIFKTGRQH